jgi:hypothetical protein
MLDMIAKVMGSDPDRAALLLVVRELSRRCSIFVT